MLILFFFIIESQFVAYKISHTARISIFFVPARLFVAAKSRIYKIVPKMFPQQRLPYPSVISAGASAPVSKAFNDGATSSISAATILGGGGNVSGVSGDGGLSSSYELNLVLEENAKWHLAADILQEIQDVHRARFAVLVTATVVVVGVVVIFWWWWCC